MGFRVGPVQKLSEIKNYLKDKKKEVKITRIANNKEHIKFKDILKKLI